jgi:thioredoxin-like negative regulator of GroEL
MFDLAAKAAQKGDSPTAGQVLRALCGHPNLELRTEARFRLAMVLAQQRSRLTEAAVLLRQILNEKPKAAGVRVELARIDAVLGHTAQAARELRAAQATGGLPPGVEQAIRFYAQAMDARRPVGGGFELGLAPDSNINHATRASTLDTVLGRFTLNPDAQASSGLGLVAQG